MNGLTFISYVLLMVVAIYQITVSIIIWRAEEFEKSQRVFQLLIIWLIPIFGALGSHLFYEVSEAQFKLREMNS